jgi:GTP-binding protein HflX
MLESSESLLPRPFAPESDRHHGSPTGQRKLKVITVGLEEDSLDELGRLLTTLDVEIVDRMVMSTRNITPATYVGRGKIEELREMLGIGPIAEDVSEAKRFTEAGNADALVIDVELSPNQLRNIEKLLAKPILDRPGVIIEIFSRHARTKESKTQVELARLQYLLPRLAHFWTHFERQRGGSPGSRGMGEKQIEVDRRLVKKRISVLRERLKGIEKERKVQRAGRKDVLKVALVGYTNAGKSTLLNSLTQSAVLAEDKLFATLDASIRALDPHCHPPIVAIDTVGFISKLPTSLVASFRSTLEEVQQADFLVHVVDASSPQAREQLEVTEKVLKELEVGETPRMIVLNKADQITTPGGKLSAKVISPGATLISALNSKDVIALRDQILEHFRKRLELWEVLIPYDQSKLESQLYAHGSVELNRHLEKGTFYRLRMEEGWAKKLELKKFKI